MVVPSGKIMSCMGNLWCARQSTASNQKGKGDEGEFRKFVAASDTDRLSGARHVKRREGVIRGENQDEV